MAFSLDYRTRDIPVEVLTGYALSRRVTAEEAELRLRAVLQMQERILQLLERYGDLPRWGDVRGGAETVMAEIDRLCGDHRLLRGEEELRLHASFLALMFFDDDADIADPTALARIPRSWWSTPLGQLCDRVLRVDD